LTRVCTTSLCHFIRTTFKFETALLIYPKPDSNTAKHSEKTTELAQKLSAGHPTHGQPQHGVFSSSDAGAAHTAFSTEHHVKLVARDAPSGKEIARLEDGRHIELERQLSETLVARIAQLTDELALKSALLERAAEEKTRAGLEQRELKAKLDALFLSRDQAEANVAEAKKRAGLEQHELQAKLDEMLLSRDQTEANAAEEKERAGKEQRELQAKVEQLLLSRDQAEANAAEAKECASLDQRELQAKPDELLLSRDQALERTQSALQKATFRTAEANERGPRGQRELAEMHAKLEARESELAAVRLRLMDAEVGWAKSKAEADTLRAGTQTAAGLVNMDVDRVMRRLMERVRSVEAEIASLQGNEKSIGEMECRNEG
jgi:chromosome segregation ATPase